ncbi:MAG: peptide chain release factor N(5)-glutamine methyltransferase, partial [Pyrinomonadaceae bacterium]
SNPPYIAGSEAKTIQPEVGSFEPHDALFSGPEGLDVITRLVAESPQLLKTGGLLLVEIGSGQSSAVADLFTTGEWEPVDFISDLQGVARVARSRRK